MAGVAGSAREEAPQAQEVMVGWPFQAQEEREVARSEVCATVGDHEVAAARREVGLELVESLIDIAADRTSDLS